MQLPFSVAELPGQAGSTGYGLVEIKRCPTPAAPFPALGARHGAILFAAPETGLNQSAPPHPSSGRQASAIRTDLPLCGSRPFWLAAPLFRSSQASAMETEGRGPQARWTEGNRLPWKPNQDLPNSGPVQASWGVSFPRAIVLRPAVAESHCHSIGVNPRQRGTPRCASSRVRATLSCGAGVWRCDRPNSRYALRAKRRLLL